MLGPSSMRRTSVVECSPQPVRMRSSSGIMLWWNTLFGSYLRAILCQPCSQHPCFEALALSSMPQRACWGQPVMQLPLT